MRRQWKTARSKRTFSGSETQMDTNTRTSEAGLVIVGPEKQRRWAKMHNGKCFTCSADLTEKEAEKQFLAWKKEGSKGSLKKQGHSGRSGDIRLSFNKATNRWRKQYKGLWFHCPGSLSETEARSAFLVWRAAADLRLGDQEFWKNLTKGEAEELLVRIAKNIGFERSTILINDAWNNQISIETGECFNS